MVFRVYVEKKQGLAAEASALTSDLRNLLGIISLDSLRVINRYDVEGIDNELFQAAVRTIFSEPQLDDVFYELDLREGIVFAVEPLPGQFDQRADSAAQCIQLATQVEKPLVATAKVYVLYGNLSDAEIKQIKNYVINPVEAREAVLSKPETLRVDYEIPTSVEKIDGFCELDSNGLKKFVANYGLAMDESDAEFCQAYFKSEGRQPTVTEIRMIDTYWSDHCRHTTFLTTIDKVVFEDDRAKKAYEEYLADRRELGREEKPVNLMDLATVVGRLFKKQGKLDKLDVSEEINACTVKIKVNVDGEEQDWLLLFKNETHNHPTEIEPFGGAATCLGGAIRDPLSGRAYVYSAMRVTGAGNPLTPVSETVTGKLPQRKIVTTAAAGYSSYGNQIGLATGIVDELYHDGYVAKRMEIGAVIGAAPCHNVVRECPLPDDVVILLGGRTGRDGCGGATGSSKAHSTESLSTCGAEVQKGNAPEERKLQRLFRNAEASRLIKRCNDFGAGGVSVAIGELADGLDINLNAVPRKYDGLDGTELAISESQERMAVVVAKKDVARFKELASQENLEATEVAVVKAEPRLTMRWNGKVIVDVSRDFLNSNGAEKHTEIKVNKPKSDILTPYLGKIDKSTSVLDALEILADDLNICSKRGLGERFDSTIGAGTVLMPYGGKYQETPIQAMVNKISVEHGETDDCSFMSWGYNPYLTSADQYKGAYLAVVESVAKLIATGASFEDVYLTFQEYFEKPKTSPERWGKPLAALLGAYKAQKDFGIASIGGKDSMSGTFEKIDVPPTLVSFAVTTGKTTDALSPEYKRVGSRVVLLAPKAADGIPDADDLIALFNEVNSLIKQKKIMSAYTVGYGGVLAAVMKQCFGNGIGFEFADIGLDQLLGEEYGSFVVELADGAEPVREYTLIGTTTAEKAFRCGGKKVALERILEVYSRKLESVYPSNIKQKEDKIEKIGFDVRSTRVCGLKNAEPSFLIPVFPGTNCEYDTAKAVERAGGKAEIFVIRNLSASDIERSVQEFAKKVAEANVVFIPGGFSGGDEPDGSAKFITSFFRNAEVKNAVHDLLDKRDGLMAGICNGFQALIKLGLLTHGRIADVASDEPTLTYNTIARHQSRIVQTRICSVLSPWLSLMNVGDIVNVPISHGEGRFTASDKWIERLAKNGQILTQYVDLDGNPTSDVRFNPNDSALAIEGITSPDGRVLGKMGHSERIGAGLYQNVKGNYDIRLFESAVKYFK